MKPLCKATDNTIDKEYFLQIYETDKLKFISLFAFGKGDKCMRKKSKKIISSILGLVVLFQMVCPVSSYAV